MGTFFDILGYLKTVRNFGKSLVASRRHKIPGEGEGHFNFICTGVCGHRIGKLTHPQTKAGPKTDPFSDYLQ